VTDQPDPDIATLELRHRRRARVEDRIRYGKAMGLRNLPVDRWRRNQVWLELVLMANDLLHWTQALLLDGELARVEPKALRYRLLHIAARVVRHARPITVPLQRTWPWAPTWPPRSLACVPCRCAAEATALPRRASGSPGPACMPAAPMLAARQPPRRQRPRSTSQLNPVGDVRIAAEPPVRPRPAPRAPHEKPRLAPSGEWSGRALGGPSVRAARGGRLSLLRLLLMVVPQEHRTATKTQPWCCYVAGVRLRSAATRALPAHR
jgi:hypothetical protein